MKSNKSLVSLILFFFGLFISITSVQAEEPYPNKPIKIILGITPGASTDFLAREVARGLSERLKVPVIVENKPGANTIIANNIVSDKSAIAILNILYEWIPSFDFPNISLYLHKFTII